MGFYCSLAFTSAYKQCVFVSMGALQGNICMQFLDGIRIISSRPLSSTMFLACNKLPLLNIVALRVVQVLMLHTIQHFLPLARAESALCIHCLLGQQVILETRHTRAVTQFPSTANENNISQDMIW